MRVMIFFDGRNFYSGWRRKANAPKIDFDALTRWVTEEVGGSIFWGAHYYTGIDPDPIRAKPLIGFLNMVELKSGFIVHRFRKKDQHIHCEECDANFVISQEKAVDTSIVADMLKYAPTYDIAVLVSGDADYIPAVVAAGELGKKVYIATWGDDSASQALRRAAFDHIDLMNGLKGFVI